MRAATVVLVLAVSVLPAAADTVVLKSGKKREGVVQEGTESAEVVVLNPFNSRCPQMTYGIEKEHRIPIEQVAEVILADPPLVEYRRRAWEPALWAPEAWGEDKLEETAAAHLELAKHCEKHKLAEERDREYRLALCAKPDEPTALAAVGRLAWTNWAKGNPLADAELRRLEREYLAIEKPGELAVQWDLMEERGTTRPRLYLERARRSARFPAGRREKVPLTVRSELAPGATYCIWIPKGYDPLLPTGLVVGLHGGGRGGSDPTLVTGSGEQAMNFYVDLAERHGFIVVCPTALEAPWSAQRNDVLLDALLEEMKILYNVDETRIWLTGHSMGGFGSWYWGPKRADVWAAFAPCAGGGGSGTAGLPVYIYHGTDDGIVGVTGDRAMATTLMKDKADFVYTEIDKVGHGFPDWAREDIFRFFAGRWKDAGKKRATGPRSSFERKPTKDELKAFGDPLAATAGDAGDTKLTELVAQLEKGGGRGVEAAKELAKRKDAKTVAALARVLHSKKAATDVRVLAASALGELAMPECLKPLAAESACEDFRVLDAVVESIGRIGGKAAFDPLARAAKQYAGFWEQAGQGNRFVFTEYEIRCQSYARLCAALAATGDAAAAIPVLEREVVGRVYAPKSPYSVPVDERFVDIPPRARLHLMDALAACLVALADPRGKDLLAAAKAAWLSEARLVAAADAAIERL